MSVEHVKLHNFFNIYLNIFWHHSLKTRQTRIEFGIYFLSFASWDWIFLNTPFNIGHFFTEIGLLNTIKADQTIIIISSNFDSLRKREMHLEMKMQKLPIISYKIFCSGYHHYHRATFALLWMHFISLSLYLTIIPFVEISN